MEENKTGKSTGAEAPPHAVPAPRAARKHSARWWIFVGAAIVLIVPAGLMAAWTAVALNWSYSGGYRAGYIQKFSRKGWVCKTWEGERQTSNIPGSAPQIFLFTVRDDSVAQQLTQIMGSRVNLHYQEHRGIPGSCFGDTNYYVTGAKVVQ
jgi:hypothetical protein